MRLFSPPDVAEPLAAQQGIGVVIPVYNRRTTLLDTLPFVVEQTLPPARLVIVDDGSIDGTAAAAEAWLARRRPNFRWEVIRARHNCAAAARNIGLEEVQSLPLVAFLDSDDHWPADFLARAASALAENPRAVAAVADRRFIDAFGERVEDDDCRRLVKNPINWFFQHGAGVASCSVLRKDAVLAVGAWSTEFDNAEDSVLFCEMTQHGPWIHVPGDPVKFHLGTARARHEEHNLSQRNADSHLGWARVHEVIYQRLCAANPTAPRSELHKSLGMRWYWAGKQLFAIGRADEARECFRRAIAWQPTMFRAWRRLASARKPLWVKPSAAPEDAAAEFRAAG